MALVDNAVYVDGRRTADPTSLDETYEVLRARAWHGMARTVSTRSGGRLSLSVVGVLVAVAAGVC
ncbi:MAG: magnesium and cobalt transport protein CorA [Frankiales bacterium]|nr:magnesium and cobalt transport protein CorA [Frankiales bacterium]